MARVQCPACQHTNVDANFCDRCGAALCPRVLCGGCGRLVVGAKACKDCGAPSTVPDTREGGLAARMPSWLQPSREWPVLMRRLGVGMLALAAALTVGRALADDATWTGVNIARLALLCCAGVLFLTLRGGRVVGIVALLPFVIAALVALSRGFSWIGAIEVVTLAGVIVVLMQPGARAVLDRDRPHPVGPMPEWISDLGHLAAAALWVAPLNVLSMLLRG